MEEPLYIKEIFHLDLREISGPIEGVEERIRKHALSYTPLNTYRNHELIITGGWGEDDEINLAVKAERLETEREVKRRLQIEERNRKARERWEIEHEKEQRDLYEFLKKKFEGK